MEFCKEVLCAPEDRLCRVRQEFVFLRGTDYGREEHNAMECHICLCCGVSKYGEKKSKHHTKQCTFNTKCQAGSWLFIPFYWVWLTK